MKLKSPLTTLVTLAILTGSAFGAPKPPLAAPIITCDTHTGSSINILVTAGVNGAPAGFTVQWLTLDEYNANGWSSPLLCDASFSGMPQCSIYNLVPGASVSVQIGDTLFDGCGVSSTCANQPLQCGTTYVFRAFAHASGDFSRSPFTPNLQCSTLPCAPPPCTYTQGYWKTHGPAACVTGNNTNVWPASAIPMLLGTVSYTDVQLCSILQTAPAGNGLVQLAHQLIATKLNIANGTDPTDAAAAVAAADALIGGLLVPPVGLGSLPNSATSALTTTLTNYNEGLTGPGHCANEPLP